MSNTQTIDVTNITFDSINNLYRFDVENSLLVSKSNKLEKYQFGNREAIYAFDVFGELEKVSLLDANEMKGYHAIKN